LKVEEGGKDKITQRRRGSQRKRREEKRREEKRREEKRREEKPKTQVENRPWGTRNGRVFSCQFSVLSFGGEDPRDRHPPAAGLGQPGLQSYLGDGFALWGEKRIDWVGVTVETSGYDDTRTSGVV